MSPDEVKQVHKKARRAILWQMIILLVAVFVVAGLLSMFLYERSLSKLIDESKDEFIEYDAAAVISCHKFIANLLLEVMRLHELDAKNPQVINELVSAVLQGQLSSFQVLSSNYLKEMTETGLLDLQTACIAVISPTLGKNNPYIIISSDNNLIYKEVPDSMADIIKNKDKPYKVFSDGIPELDFEGAHLVTVYEFKLSPAGNQIALYYDVKSIQKDIVAIESFYKEERKQIDTTLWLVVAGSVLVLFIIIFFFLSYLIRTRISKPIEELSDAAEQVMDGNLDVTVEVKEGEEFEGLKRAFNETLESMGKIFARANK